MREIDSEREREVMTDTGGNGGGAGFTSRIPRPSSFGVRIENTAASPRGERDVAGAAHGNQAVAVKKEVRCARYKRLKYIYLYI